MRSLMPSVLVLCVLPLGASAQAIIEAPVRAFTGTGTVTELTSNKVQIRVRTAPAMRVPRLTGQVHTPDEIQAVLRKSGLLPPVADFAIDDNTEMARGGRLSRNLSLLAVGDEVAIRYQVSFDGKVLAALRLTTDYITVRGIVQGTDADKIDMELSAGASGEGRTVHLSPHTVYGFTKTAAVGEEVNVVGWDFGDEIEAMRITVYNTDFQLQPPAPIAP